MKAIVKAISTEFIQSRFFQGIIPSCSKNCTSRSNM